MQISSSPVIDSAVDNARLEQVEINSAMFNANSEWAATGNAMCNANFERVVINNLLDHYDLICDEILSFLLTTSVAEPLHPLQLSPHSSLFFRFLEIWCANDIFRLDVISTVPRLPRRHILQTVN